MSDAQVTLRIMADPSGVTPGIDRAKREIESLNAAGRTAAGGLDAMGNSGRRAGQQVAAGADQAEGALQQVNGALREQIAELTDIRNITIAATAALAGMAAAASVTAAGYEKAIAQISTLLSDTSGIDALSESVRALNREFGGGAVLQAQGLADIIGAGFEDAAQSVEILRDANKLAIGGLTDVKTAADGLTTVMNAYGASVGNSAAVSDAFFTSALAGKTTIEQLASSIGSVAPIAAQTGVSLDQVLAATATLTRGGVATSTAMDGIRAAISAIIKPSSEAADLAQQLGLQFDAAALKSQGLAGFLQSVADKTGGSAEKMAVLFGGVEALAPVLTLTGNGAQGFARDLEAMANKAVATEGAVAKMADTTSFQFGRLKAAGEDILIGVGQALNEGFAPAIKFIADALPEFAASWSSTFSQASEVVNQLTSDGTSLAGMYRNYVESVLGATGDVVGDIVKGFAVLPLTLSATFTAVIAAGDLAWISLKTGAERLSLDLQSLWVAIKAAGVRAFGELAIEAAGQLDRLVRGVRQNATAIGAALSAISPAAGAAFRAASAELSQYGSLQEQVRQGVANTSAELDKQAAELAKLTQQSFDNRAALIAGSRAALDAAVAEQQAAVARIGAVRAANAAVAAGVTISTQAAAATAAHTAATQANAEALRAQATAAGVAGVGLAGATASIGAFAGATASAAASQPDLADATQQAAEDSARYWAGATGAMAQAFGDFVASGLRSFSDFGRSLKRIAQQIISDLIAQFAKQRIVIPIMLGAGFSPGAIAGATGMSPGAVASAASGGGTGMFGGLLGGIGSAIGGFTAGLGVAGSAGIVAAGQFGLASLAAGNLAVGFGALAGALGPVALALGAIDAITGGRLFGTSFKTNSAGTQFNFGAEGASGFTFQEQSRQRSLFRGRRFRTVTEALGDDAQAQIDGVFEAVGQAVATAARQLGVDVPPLIASSFRATTDAQGNVVSEVGTILGRQYNESFEQFARRIAAENVIGVLDAALDGEAGRIAEAWRGSADQLADGAQFLLTAATDMRGGFRLLGDASLTGVAELVQRLAGDGESLTAAYQRISGATRLLDEAVALSGVNLDMTREQFVTFAAGIAEAAGGLDRAQGLWSSYFQNFYSEQERGLVQLQQARTRASGLGSAIGLNLSDFTGEGGAAAFREMFESRLPSLSSEQVVQWLEFANSLGIVIDLQGRYTDAVMQTAESISDFMVGVDNALSEFSSSQTLQERLDAQKTANEDMLSRARELGASESELARVRELGDRRINAIIDDVQERTDSFVLSLRMLGAEFDGTNEAAAVAAQGVSDSFGKLTEQFLEAFDPDGLGMYRLQQAQIDVQQALARTGLSVDQLANDEMILAAARKAAADGNFELAESIMQYGLSLRRESDLVAQGMRDSAAQMAESARLFDVINADIANGFNLLGEGSVTQVSDLIVGLRADGESLAQTYERVSGSTKLLDNAVLLSGVNLDITREAFVEFATQIADAAGGLQRAQSLWSSYFENFYTQQERGLAQLQQARTRASGLASGIGLNLSDFSGEGGAAAFRTLFEQRLPSLTAEQVVKWLEFAQALGIVIDLQGRYTDAVIQTAESIKDFMSGVDAALQEFTPEQTLQQRLDAQRTSNEQMIARARELGASEAELSRVRELGERRINAIISEVQDRTNGFVRSIGMLGVAFTGTGEQAALAAQGVSESFASVTEQFLEAFDPEGLQLYKIQQAQFDVQQALARTGMTADQLATDEMILAAARKAASEGNFELAESIMQYGLSLRREAALFRGTAETIEQFMAGINAALSDLSPNASIEQQLAQQRTSNDQMIERARALGASEADLARVRELGEHRINAIISQVQGRTDSFVRSLGMLGTAFRGTNEAAALAAQGVSESFATVTEQFLEAFDPEALGMYRLQQAQIDVQQALARTGLSADQLANDEMILAAARKAASEGNYELAESIMQYGLSLRREAALIRGTAAGATGPAPVNNGNGNMFGLGGGGGQLDFGAGLGGGDDPAGGLVSDIERIRQGLRDWLTSLTTGDLSPERPREQLRRAQAEYQRLLTLAQGGDADALRQLQGASELVLRLGRQVFGSSAGYTALYQQILSQVGGLVGFTAGSGVSGPGGGGRPGDLPGVTGLESAATSAAAALEAFAARLGMPAGSLTTGLQTIPSTGPVPTWIGSTAADTVEATAPVVAELRASRVAAAAEGERMRRELEALRAEMAQLKQAQTRVAVAAERANDLRR